MLGLPSTTEVEQILPKSGFYKNLDIDARTKDLFVSTVRSIVIRNVIRPDTCNLVDGKRVHEMFVIELEPKKGEVPEAVVRTIMRANQSRMVVVDGGTGATWAKGPSGLFRADDVGSLSLRGADLDGAWDSILAQLALGEEDGEDVAKRIERAEAVKTLEREIDALDKKCRRERQVSRRNELFAHLRKKRRELEALRKGA